MLYATKIQMHNNCETSNRLTDIAAIFLEGNSINQFYEKCIVHDHLKQFTESIRVNIDPYPYLHPVIGENGEKFVCSEINDLFNDNLLKLPRQ